MASQFPVTLTSTVIAYYKTHTLFSLAEWFGDRIAVRQKFSAGWAQGKLGLTIRLDGGSPDNYTLQQQGRLEARIYGPTPERCDDAFALIERDVQEFERTVVNGEVVLQMLTLETQASYLHDQDTNLAMYLFFLNAAARTEYVTA